MKHYRLQRPSIVSGVLVYDKKDIIKAAELAGFTTS